MRTHARISMILGLSMVLASIAIAQSKPSKPESNPWMSPPDDRYVKLLAGKKLEENGFPGVVTLGEAVWDVAQRIGSAREEMEWLWWYFYETGPWQLTVCCTMAETEMGIARVHAVIVAGDGAPATSKGIKVGDPVSKLTATYGAAQPFRGALVGLDSKGKKSVWHMAGGDSKDVTVDDPPEFKDALFFPAAKLLVAVEKDRVLKLAIVGEEDSLPVFLLPQEKIRPDRLTSLKIDPTVNVPTPDKSTRYGFLLPPPPELVDYKGAGWSGRVPKGWTLADDVWTDPSGFESVTIQSMKATPEESTEAAMFVILEIAGGENLVKKWRRPMPASFCKMVGATDGFCAATVAEGRGKDGLPLRTYRLMLTKGGRRYLITVTRTQHSQKFETEEGDTQTGAFMGCPDGDALARGVMRSFRITQ